MDFECDFNDLNFCQYSNLGWGFHKSVKFQNNINQSSNFRNEGNYYPCSVSNNLLEGSKMEKKISLNLSESFCLQFAYLLEDKGHILVTNGKNKWSKNASGSYTNWNYVKFPIDIHKEHLREMSPDSTILKITGESVCVDNFTISPQPCPFKVSTFNNNLSSFSNLWITQPFSLLIAIIIFVILFTLIGVISSVLFAKKTQSALLRSKKLSRKIKEPRLDRYSFQNSIENSTTIDSSCEIDTLESNPIFALSNPFLPTLVHIRNNNHCVHYSRQSFAASPSLETSESTPHYRFSLALTEDAQVQLLTNTNNSSISNNNNNNSNVSPPSTHNMSLLRQQSTITILNHENSPNEINRDNQGPNSITLTPNFCATIIDQSESDLSIQSEDPSEQSIEMDPSSSDRQRPIRESMNVGYISDTSLCDLPHYDTAVQLLAENKIKLAHESDITEDYRNNKT